MKRLLLGVFVFALIFSSCNKYADDFQALKDQIAALSAKVDGVATLQTQLAATTATVNAIKTAVDALPASIAAQFVTVNASLTAVTTKITALQTSLDAVALAGQATKAVVDGLKTALDKIATDKTAADAALNAKLVTLEANLTAAIAAGTTANAAKIAAAQSDILASIVSNALIIDNNVNAKLQAAQAALTTLINANMATTNAAIDTKVAAAVTALKAYSDVSLDALKLAIQTSLNNGLATTDANVNAKIAALTIALNTGLAGVNADVDAKIADAKSTILALISATDTDLATKIEAAKTALNTAISAAVTATNGNTNTQIAALQLALTTVINSGNGILAGQIAAVQTAIQGDPSNTDATKLTIQGLQLALQAAQRDITIILNASQMYNGDVNITTDADVDGYFLKLNQMSIINGNVTVNTSNISGTKIANLNVILSKLVAVIGVNTDYKAVATTVEILGGWWLIPGEPVVTEYLIKAQAGDGHWCSIFSRAADHLSADALVSVRGDYTVGGADIVDTKIDNVGGSFTYNYPGAYVSGVKTVGVNLVLVNQPTNGTGNINFANVMVGNFVADHIDATLPLDYNNSVTFNSTATKSIVFALVTGGQINNLTANYATSITLGTTHYSALGLTITADAALVAPDVAREILLSAALSSVGPVTIATGAAPAAFPALYAAGTGTLVDLSNLVTSGNLTAWVAPLCLVKLDKFDSAVAVDIRGDQDLIVPVWLGQSGASLNAPETLTLTLPMYRWWSVSALGTIPTTNNLYRVETLTLGNALENVLISAYPTLKKAVITGAVYPGEDQSKWATISAGTGVKVPGVTSAGNALLNWLQVNGIMNTVNVTNVPLLANIATADTINTFKLNNAGNSLAATTTVTLNHANFQGKTGYGGPGSDLWLTNSNKYTSLTTNKVNKMNSIKITDNATLAALDLHSYTLPVTTTGFTVSLEVFNNALVGSFQPAVLEFGTTNYFEAKIWASQLVGLRNYVATLVTNPLATFSTFKVDVDKSTLLSYPLLTRGAVAAQAVGAVNKLSSSMYLNALVSSVIPDGNPSTAGISSPAEMALIQN